MIKRSVQVPPFMYPYSHQDDMTDSPPTHMYLSIWIYGLVSVISHTVVDSVNATSES